MNKKLFMKGFLAAILSIAFATIFGSSASYAEAVITRGLFTDSNDVRWEWQKTIDDENTEEPEMVSIMFYDKPAATTEIVVPSLSDVITAANATFTLNTYYVRNADEEAQATNFPSETKRQSTADVTKLDMTNTSKVQIMGVKPILNPETEAELVFGENMVIGDDDLDTEVTYTIEAKKCSGWELVQIDTSWGGLQDRYRCTGFEDFVYDGGVITLGYDLTERRDYYMQYWPYNEGYSSMESEDTVLYPSEYPTDRTYVLADHRNEKQIIETKAFGGAFANYKLKLTNLENVKYLGWHAFYNSTFDESSRDITIKANQTAGEGVFARTNVRNVTFEGNEVFPAMFDGCTELGDINFGAVSIIGYDAFSNTKNLGDLDFSNTNVKTIMDRAFMNAGVTSVDFGSIEKIGAKAFMNDDIRELYLPKSINELGRGIFIANTNLKKATIAYDTLTTGTRLQFFMVLDGYWMSGGVQDAIEELVILAPYTEDEPVKTSHMSYSVYRNSLPVQVSVSLYNNMYQWGGEWRAEDKYMDFGSMKNIVAPIYFSQMSALKKITIGEGYEYIGAGCFYDNAHEDGYTSWDDITSSSTLYVPSSTRPIEKVSLPESLRGVGTIALTSVFNENFEMNLPQNIEFLGFGAFRRLFQLDVDVDLPKLKFLGDYAFYSTKVHDIVLHDGLDYLGVGAFNDCPAIHDVTFDYDVFNPETFHWWLNGSTSTRNHRTMLGTRYDRNYNREIVDYYGFDLSGNERSSFTINSITFTEKSIHQLPALCEEGYNCSESSIAFFDYITINKVDMSKARWEFIPIYAFQDAYLGEVLLPENLKSIHSAAFMDAVVEKEIVLPETLETIEDAAFSQTYTKYHYNKDAIKITKLPKGLKTIGTHAFCSDDGLVIDELDLPNLEYVGNNAFVGATIKRIVLHDKINHMEFGAFYFIKGVEDLVIDFDIFNTSAYSVGVSLLRGAVYVSGLFAPNFYYPFHLQTYFSLFEPYEYEPGKYTNPVNFTEANDDRVYNSIVFTEKSKTEPGVSMFTSNIKVPCQYGEWSEDYCYKEDGGINWNGRSYYSFFASTFYGIRAKEIDLSAAKWSSITQNAFNAVDTETIKLPSTLSAIYDYSFYGVSVDNPIEMPAGIQTIGTEAFQYADIELKNAFSEGLESIEDSAFYGATIRGDLTIPSTVTSIGQSAFNAGDTDTHYNTVTIKPALDYGKTDDQAVFQMFWNAKMDKLVIESPMLPVLGTLQAEPILPDDIEVDGVMVSPLRADGEPEFHSMTMKEVEITNLPEITANAFEECANLEKVTLSSNAALSRIDQFAFNNDTKLKQIVFGEANNDHDISIEGYAFNNTAIETLGTTDAADFNLAAANFNLAEEHVFSNMPKLKSVDIPNNFNVDPAMANEEKNVNGAYITSFTFSDDPELEQVTVAYQVAEIRDGAFLNDEKLSKLFVWGNAEIQESDDLIHDFNNTTIPHATNIFAYSDAPAENYANDDSRSAYDGKFYPLDEVLYLTSNKTYVVLEQDEEGNNVDFEKDGLILYAMRRDGVILESDDWQTYTKAFTRASNPNIKFDEGRGGNLGTEDSIMWSVYDAPKPFSTISLANRNFEGVDFEFIDMPSSTNPLVAIHYPDGYTAAIRTTTLASMTKEEEEKMLEELEVPNTGVIRTIAGVAVPSISIATIVVLGGIYVARKRKN